MTGEALDSREVLDEVARFIWPTGAEFWFSTLRGHRVLKVQAPHSHHPYIAGVAIFDGSAHWKAQVERLHAALTEYYQQPSREATA